MFVYTLPHRYWQLTLEVFTTTNIIVNNIGNGVSIITTIVGIHIGHIVDVDVAAAASGTRQSLVVSLLMSVAQAAADAAAADWLGTAYH